MTRFWRWQGSCSIAFKSSILKDLSFRVCKGYSWGCEKKDSYMNSKGNLQRKPNMRKIQNIINKYLETESIKNKDTNNNLMTNKLMTTLFDFYRSHEIIFYDEIPIDYISFIIVRGENFEDTKKLFPSIEIINYDEIIKNINSNKKWDKIYPTYIQPLFEKYS